MALLGCWTNRANPLLYLSPCYTAEDLEEIVTPSWMTEHIQYMKLPINTEPPHNIHQTRPCALLIKHRSVVKLWKPQHIQVIALPFSMFPIFNRHRPIISACQIRPDYFCINDQVAAG